MSKRGLDEEPHFASTFPLRNRNPNGKLSRFLEAAHRHTHDGGLLVET